MFVTHLRGMYVCDSSDHLRGMYVCEGMYVCVVSSPCC